MRTISLAIKDIRAGLDKWRLAVALALENIGDQHRHTTLGPLWLLLNYLLFAGSFIAIFGHGTPTPNYAAYSAIGLLVWFFISEVISSSSQLFLNEESFIKGTTIPLSVYIMRLALQSVIRGGYSLLGCLAILLMSGTTVSSMWLWSALGVILVVITAPAAIMVFAMLGVAFPDSQFIIGNLMRLGIFVTPVFWVHTGGGGIRGAFYYWNPFTYFLEVVRAPIVAGDVPAGALILCAVMSAVLWIVAIILLGRYRKSVVFLL